MSEDKATNEVVTPSSPESVDRPVSSRQAVAAARKDVRLAKRTARKTGSRSGKRFGAARAVGTMAAVCALIAGVAIPAYAASQSEHAPDQTASAREEAAAEAQLFDAGDAAPSDLATTSYSARTAEEIDQLQAEEAALKRAEEERRRQQEQEQNNPQGGAPAGAPPAPPAPAPDAPPAPEAVPGGWINPLGGPYYISRSVGNGHEGADMVTVSQQDWTVPIYAAKAGTVITSGEVVGGWGNTIAIDHGDGTTTLYGHMTPGSRQVQVGASVEQGQLIGYVGSTGRSTAHHLHIELRINGVIVAPEQYLPI